MKPISVLFAAALALSACGGNPFGPQDPTKGAPDGTTGTPLPTSGKAISRQEVKVTTQTKDYGNGFAEAFKYNSADDTFSVDGLGFDGANVYQRGTAVASVGGFRVYEGDNTYFDDETGAPINQFEHRAIYGVSKNGKTSFAVVRTGAYIPYGFGGFIYKRNGGVTLPSSGQAAYTGNYAALRDFDGRGGLEYSRGSMQVAIDFEDFNDGDAVQGTVTNRAIYDINGQNITNSVITALNADLDPAEQLTELPTLVFSVGPGAIKSSGEVSGKLTSNYLAGGTSTQFESGKYYALVTDTDALKAGEIVGVIVVEGKDPRYDAVTVRETGGFILYR